MKKLSIILLLFCINSSAFSQKEKELSNAESFSLKSGGLIQKEFVDLATIKGVKFQAMTITDLLTENKTKALRIEMSITKSYGSAEKTAVLDADEVEGFLKSMRLIESKILNTTVQSYTEIEYKARGGFKGGCFSDAKKGWSFFIKLDKFDSDSYLFLKKEEVPELIKIFDSAKDKLQ